MDRTKAIACLIAVLFTGCSRSARIVVGSKNFTEQIIVGEILAQHLERRLKLRVDRKFNMGGTLLTQQALVNGAIDLYPEYTGTALNAVLKISTGAHTPADVFERVRAEYEKRWRLTWLPPLGFDNTFAIAIRGELARTAHLATLSEAARQKKDWRFGAGYEFVQRPDGLTGLLKTYGLRINDSPKSMDLGLLYRALQNNQVDMVAANSTDGLLSVLDVAVLRDDKRYFPPYQCAVVVRDAALSANPQLRAALEELSGAISDSVIRKLNYMVDGEHRPVPQVVTEYLATAARQPKK